MLGHGFGQLEEIDESERDRALMAQPIWQRSLVSLAGPLFNFVLPIFLFGAMALGQAEMPPADIGQVLPDTPAARAGLQAGDDIVAIDGEPISYWHQITDRVRDAYNREISVTVERNGSRKTFELSPEKTTRTDFLGLNPKTFGLIGIYPGHHGPTIAIGERNGPAAKAGLRHFDRIVTVDGTPVSRFTDITRAISNSGGKPLEMRVLQRTPVEVSYAQMYRQTTRSVSVTPTKRDGEWTIGIDPAQMYVSEVDDTSPAARAGLMAGDRIRAIDGKRFDHWSRMATHINNTINEHILDQYEEGLETDEMDTTVSFNLSYRRGDEVIETSLVPDVIWYTGESKQKQFRVYIGWGHLSDTKNPDMVAFPLSDRIPYAIGQGWSRTIQTSQAIVVGVWRLIQGRIDFDTVGGPIMIGQLAAKAGSAGFAYFLIMMAFISLNLAIFNLLPIPVLDGGHLMMYAVEAIQRKPLSFRTRQILTYIGFMFLLFLMLYATVNDIDRAWGDIVDWFANF
jgi:regulator of sigma E protease